MSERSEKGHSLVSVIVPSFKMGHFIGEALESVGAQTYPHWEVIVVDDAGPEDGTRAKVAAFGAKYPDHRVEYIRHEKNRGVSVARRTAFEAARGEYIAFLDADDAFLPEKMARHVDVLERNADCVLVHGSIEVKGQVSEGAADPINWFNSAYPHGAYTPKSMGGYLKQNHICNSTVVCRSICLSADDFPRGMAFQYEDWLLWLYLSLRGRFYFCDSIVTLYRCHEGAFSSAIHRSESAQALAHYELLLAFSPVAVKAGLDALVARQMLECSKVLAGDVDSEAACKGTRALMGSLFLSAGLQQKWLDSRVALGRAKRLFLGLKR